MIYDTVTGVAKRKSQSAFTCTPSVSIVNFEQVNAGWDGNIGAKSQKFNEIYFSVTPLG